MLPDWKRSWRTKGHDCLWSSVICMHMANYVGRALQGCSAASMTTSLVSPPAASFVPLIGNEAPSTMEICCSQATASATTSVQQGASMSGRLLGNTTPPKLLMPPLAGDKKIYRVSSTNAHALAHDYHGIAVCRAPHSRQASRASQKPSQ